MGKITVKHFLNTNLKPYNINGVKYYSIYLLVTANRQNTKVKSYTYNEYYSENDFIEITNSDNKEDSALLNNEVQTVTTIAEMIINELELFDTALFAAIYNFFSSIYVFELNLDHIFIDAGNKKYIIDLHDKTKNKLGINISDYFLKEFSMKENNSNGMSIYTYYSPIGQKELHNFLKDSHIPMDINEAIKILNQLVFYKACEKLSWIFRGSNKYSALLEKYDRLFNWTDEIYCTHIYEKLGVNRI